MQPYQRTRQQRDKRANVTGILVTVAVHALALIICLTSGLSYLDPPPPERTSLKRNLRWRNPRPPRSAGNRRQRMWM